MDQGSRRVSMGRRGLLRLSAGMGMAILGAACASTPAPAPTAVATKAPAQATAAPAQPTMAPAKPTLAPTQATQSQSGGSKAKMVWMVRTSPAENKWEQSVIDAFREKQPSSDISLLALPQGQVTQKKAAMLAAGDQLDIYCPGMGGNGYADDLIHGLMYDLTDAVKRDKYDLSDIYPSIYDSYGWKGRQYGIPALGPTPSLFVYNIDLWQQAGVKEPPTTWGDESWTWDELLTRLKKVSKVTDDVKTSVYGAASGWFEISNFSRGFNGADPGGSGDPWTKEWWTDLIAEKTAFDSPEVVGAVTWYQSLFKEKISPSQEVAKALSQLGDPFLTGRVASEICAANFNGYKDIKAFKWGVAPWPHLPGKPTKTWFYVDPWSIWARTKAFDQGWEFLKYLCSEEGTRGWVVGVGYPGARKPLFDLWLKSIGYHDEATFAQLSEDCIKNSFDTDNHHIVGFDTLNTIVDQNSDQIWSLKAEPEAVLKSTNQRVEEAASRIKAGLAQAAKQ